ncbi:MAG TPA: class I SAM-dependent methyltransferase [Kofleriaceae bacterium]|nr:class I SAM-dependent methyltransferase [Kofleriaceae bacterium]
MAERRSETISPTAHYTGYVWFANGLSHPAFATREGKLFYEALRPANAASKMLGGPTLEGMLLARHRVIDHLLSRAIEDGRVSQIVEVAAGLSPRGWRFTSRHGETITYVEADLPEMAARKREILRGATSETEHHRVVEIDALADDGPRSIGAICEALDPSRGVAIITEGLLNYFDAGNVRGMWKRFAAALARFPHGLYLADLSIASESGGPLAAMFATMLGVFVRGKVHVHFQDAAHAESELVAAGFASATLHRPVDFTSDVGEVEESGASRVRIVEALSK